MLSNKFKNKKVVFAGCARDCEKYLEKTLSNIDYYASLFEKSYQIIVENGSKDNTRERIRQIEAKALRKLKHPSRSKQLKSFLES